VLAVLCSPQFCSVLLLLHAFVVLIVCSHCYLS
jgi:hypothetical protein